MALTFNKFLKISHTYVINITRFTLKFSDHRFYRQLTPSRGEDRTCDRFLFDCISTQTQYYVAPKMIEKFKVVGVSDEIAEFYHGRLCNTHYERSLIRNLSVYL
jgi:hypothetical protein